MLIQLYFILLRECHSFQIKANEKKISCETIFLWNFYITTIFFINVNLHNRLLLFIKTLETIFDVNKGILHLLWLYADVIDTYVLFKYIHRNLSSFILTYTYVKLNVLTYVPILPF